MTNIFVGKKNCKLKKTLYNQVCDNFNSDVFKSNIS